MSTYTTTPSKKLNASLPVLIVINEVESYHGTFKFYTWAVRLGSMTIARCASYDEMARTRVAAIKAAKRGIKDYAKFLEGQYDE